MSAETDHTGDGRVSTTFAAQADKYDDTQWTTDELRSIQPTDTTVDLPNGG
jgi:hypothetical protein